MEIIDLVRPSPLHFSDPVDEARCKIYHRIIYIVWSTLILYSFIFYFLWTPFIFYSVFFGATLVLPIIWYLNRQNLTKCSKTLLMIYGSFTIYTGDVGLSNLVNSEYYYIVASMLAFLIFDRDQTKHLIAGICLPLFFGLLTTTLGHSYLPPSWYRADVPVQLLSNINFLGAYVLATASIFSYLTINIKLRSMLIKEEINKVALDHKLKEKEKDLWIILENLKNEFYIFDKFDFSFVEQNEAALENLGYKKGELKDKKPWDIKPEISEAEFKKIVEPLITGREKVINFLTTHERKDGTIYPIEVHLQMSHYSGKEVFQAMIFDRTENEKLQQDLLHASRLSSIGELAAGVGHEINNPLAIAMGLVSRSKKEMIKNSSYTQKMDEIYGKLNNAHNRIKHIVTGLRTYARSSIDTSGEFEINEAIMSTVELLNELYVREGIELKVQKSKQDLYVKGSLGGFQQIITNLLSNAHDALENSEKKVIEIEVTKMGEKALVSIKDFGNGIPNELKMKIFKSFFTTKAVGKGTGLGLSISNKLCKDLGGDLWFESIEMTGTTFFIDLPIYTKSDGVIAEVSNSDEGGEDTLNAKIAKNLNVLIVDDEADIRSLLKDILEDHGCHIKEATNGVEALEVLAQSPNHFDFVFTDLKMPKMDGRKLVHKITEMYTSKRPKLIVMTGGVSDEFSKSKNNDIMPLIQAYLSKPFEEYDIIKIIENNEEKKVG